MSLVYIFLADGFEEVEGLTAVDLLRRAGAVVKTVSVTGANTVMGAHGIKVGADLLFEEIQEDADLLVLPGGMPGTVHLKEHQGLKELLLRYNREEKQIAAICAAPSVFAHLGFLDERKATSYPGCLEDCHVGAYLEEPVVRDGHITTSRGVGTAIDFALSLVETLFDREKADSVAASIVYSREG